MKIGCMTFHGSHNYGSMLQAYALQEAFKRLGADYEIINFRSAAQTNMYKSPFEKNDLKSLYLRLFLFGQKHSIRKKRDNFENFISDKLNTSNDFDTFDETVIDSINEQFDVCVTGSDQVFNIRAKDFDWNYFLEFFNKKKYSFSASMGTKRIDFSEKELIRIKKDLKTFSKVSVRDDYSLEIMRSLGLNDAQKMVDPVFLLDSAEWLNLIFSCSYETPKTEYILFYDLSRNKSNWDIAKKISKLSKEKAYITSVPWPRVISKSVWLSKRYDCGPIEFLKMLNSSSHTICSSFHGAMFSLILHKPVTIINLNHDNRLDDLIELFGLEKNTIRKADSDLSLEDLWTPIDWINVDKIINDKRSIAVDFLRGIING